jgi:hypothetical protein
MSTITFKGTGELTQTTVTNGLGTATTVIIEGYTSIGSSAFKGKTSITSVTIDYSVITIHSYAFGDCTSLTSVTIPNSVTEIGDFAFYVCSSLTSVTIPNSVTRIGNYTFATCTSLTSVTIPNSVTTIGDNGFANCTSLITVDIEDQSNVTVYTSSFTNVSIYLNSSITFYNTPSSDSLKGNWTIISNYYYNTQYYNVPICFNKGTKILCFNKQFEEEYIPIENLKKGDLVKTYKHGYRKIDLICKSKLLNNPDKINSCMYKMEKTDTNGLIEDLIVTGWHSILVDDLGECKDENEKVFRGTQMIDGKYLLLSSVSKDFIKIDNNNIYTYYHFILENNGDDNKRFGVWANGILTETPSKKTFITFNLIPKQPCKHFPKQSYTHFWDRKKPYQQLLMTNQLQQQTRLQKRKRIYMLL